ncbi:HNH endonuclease [Saccharibacillus deserti]|uniref:HNH endonuclease n=1 Tax=Saccharibacillus deserti TaxID=1634444 RepID=UPI001555B617|nr:HNH endonuclease [Saccharibacillus deserti]
MYQCIYCDAEILKRSSEHIIHAALGSSLQSDKIICKDCNNYFSRKESGDIDKKFVEQFEVFRNLLNVKNDRGKLPPTIKRLKLGNEEIILEPGGKIAYQKSRREIIKDEEGKVKFHISSPNLEKGKEQLRHIKKQYGEKAELIIEQAKLKRSYANTPIEFDFSLGGEENTKAVAKMLYNFVHYLDRESLISLPELDWSDIKQYLRYNATKSNIETGYDFINPIPIEIPKDDLSNYIFISGSSQQGIIFGHVVIFGSISFSSIIHNRYEGVDFGYGIKQPLNVKQSEAFYEFEIQPFNSNIFRDKLAYSEIQINKMGKEINKLLRIYQDKATKEAQNKLISEAMNKVFKGYEGEYFSSEILQNLSNVIADEYTKFLFRIDTETPIDLEDSTDK